MGVFGTGTDAQKGACLKAELTSGLTKFSKIDAGMPNQWYDFGPRDGAF
jgi:hypothetical protein